MILDYKKSESEICPKSIDTESSKAVVYFRKDIEEKQRTDEFSGETYTHYEYLEAKIPKGDYEKHLQEQTRADVDYIALMTGVDLEEVL